MLVGICVAVVLALTRFAFQFYAVPSGSMLPTIAVGGRIWVQKMGVNVEHLSVGEIVVFKRPPTDHLDTDIADVVKRIVALPGDVVSSAGGNLIVDGQVVREPYLRPGTATTGVVRQVVPPGHYFVMGDNRTYSYDSRFFGPIPATSIVGTVVAQVWPPSELRVF
jgi:signal peptidase I